MPFGTGLFLSQKKFFNTSPKFCLYFLEAEEVNKILTYVQDLNSKAFVLFYTFRCVSSALWNKDDFVLSRKKWRGFSLKNKYRGYEMDSHHITSLVFQFFFIPPSASAAFSFLGMVNLKIKTCNHSSPFDKERQRNLANIDST